MSRRTERQKAHRVLDFLLGCRSPDVGAALAEAGMTAEDRAEGWALLQKVGEPLPRRRARRAEPPPPRDAASGFEGLARWAARWFPVARATLRRRHPAIERALFPNTKKRAAGPGMAAVAARVFLERFDALGADHGPEGKAARAILASRGFDDAMLADARALVAAAQRLPAPVALPDPARDAAAFTAATNALWAWYLEWSVIARAAVADVRLLRALGFRPHKVDDDGEGADDDGDLSTDVGAARL